MVKNNPSLANADIDAAMMDNMIRMHMDFSQMQQLSDINAKIKAQKGITEKNFITKSKFGQSFIRLGELGFWNSSNLLSLGASSGSS